MPSEETRRDARLGDIRLAGLWWTIELRTVYPSVIRFRWW